MNHDKNMKSTESTDLTTQTSKAQCLILHHIDFHMDHGTGH